MKQVKRGNTKRMKTSDERKPDREGLETKFWFRLG
jgi:hypothetical protein